MKKVMPILAINNEFHTNTLIVQPVVILVKSNLNNSSYKHSIIIVIITISTITITVTVTGAGAGAVAVTVTVTVIIISMGYHTVSSSVWN